MCDFAFLKSHKKCTVQTYNNTQIAKDHVFTPSNKIHLHVNIKLHAKFQIWTAKFHILAKTLMAHDTGIGNICYNLQCNIKSCYLKNKLQGNCEHGPQFTLPTFFITSLKAWFHERFFSAKCEIFRLFLLNCEQSSRNNLFE
jgi:hypothetical protein